MNYGLVVVGMAVGFLLCGLVTTAPFTTEGLPKVKTDATVPHVPPRIKQSGKTEVSTNGTDVVSVIQVGTVVEKPAVDPKGLFLYLSFDKDYGDLTLNRSGDGPDGRLCAAFWTKNGKFGGGLYFDGQTGHVDLGVEVPLPTWDDYTISVWFLNDGGGDNERGYGQKIFDKTIMYHDFYLCVNQKGELVFHTYSGDGGGGLSDASMDYRDGKWHQAVIVKNGTVGKLFVDGALKCRAEGLRGVVNNGPLLLGYSKSSDGYQRKFWSGSLDELIVFRRTLNDEEVQALWKLGPAALGNSLPPKAHATLPIREPIRGFETPELF
jgi:hypothetical protein